MNLFEFFIKRPLFVNLLCIFIVVAGTAALFSMHRDLFPNVNYDMVMVTTVYDGATPQDIEKLITIPLEKELKEVDDIDEMTSASIENFSIIALKINPNAPNKDKVVNDIQRAVDGAEDLPEDLPDGPVVKEVKSRDIPVIEVSLSGGTSESRLQVHAKAVENELLDIPAVSSVTRSGWRDREIWVEILPDEMRKYHIGIAEVMRDIKRRNISMPGGKLEREEKEYLLRTNGEFGGRDDVEKVIIRANDEGNWVRVSDIAHVSDGFEERQTINRTNGRRAINLTVIKKEKADAIDLVEKVRELVSEYKARVPDAPDIRLVNDHSYYLKRRLNVLVQNGFIGVVLVIAVLVLFLNPRVAFVTAWGIPIALMTTFFTMLLFGMSINLISLFGLIIVLGMLVDDAIVVSENIFRHIEAGIPYRKAALIGTIEVWRPVISTVLTTVAAFTPLMFMSGIIGRFVIAIPFVVIIALLSSLFEAFFMLPSHIAEMGRLPRTGITNIMDFKRVQGLISKLSGWYGRLLDRALSYRYPAAAGAFLLLIISLILLKVFLLPPVLFPARGIDTFFVRAQLPVGTPLEVTEKRFEDIERLVETIPKTELDDYVTEIGIIKDNPTDPFLKRGSHIGQISVFLKPSSERARGTREIIESLRAEGEKRGLGRLFEEISFDERIPGPPVGKPVVVRIKGDDIAVLNEIAGKVMKFLEGVRGVKDVKSNFEVGKNELRVVVDEAKAAKADVMIEDVAKAVRFAFDGGVATKIKKADEEIDVRVRFPYISRYDEKTMGKIEVENQRGNLIPLREVASFEEISGISAIHHLDRKRTVSVTANVDQDVIKSAGVINRVKTEFKDITKEYPGYMMSYGGEYEETEKSMSNLYYAFILAVVLMFIILATNFKSIVQPIIVMMAIPFGFIGVIISFIAHSQPLSFLGLIGAVGLSGVVVNSSIILVDFINKRREDGMEMKAAIIDAGKTRFRPVLLTTLTTVVGLVSVAYGLWGSDPILIPAALAIMWGLIFATVLTLIIIPCFYAILDDTYGRFKFMKFWRESDSA